MVTYRLSARPWAFVSMTGMSVAEFDALHESRTRPRPTPRHAQHHEARQTPPAASERGRDSPTAMTFATDGY